MADEKSDKPVTDSRFPGFDPVADASKAAAAASAGQGTAQGGAKAESEAAPLQKRGAKQVMLEVLHALNDRTGNHDQVTALIKELEEL
jgi:hypothetical protein